MSFKGSSAGILFALLPYGISGGYATDNISLELVSCPKCGFEQDESPECQRCGVIFERYRPQSATPQAFETLPPAIPLPGRPTLLRKTVRILVLAAIPLVVLAGVSTFWGSSAAPIVSSDVRASERVNAKLRNIEFAADLGRPVVMDFDEAEVNAWMRSVLLSTGEPSRKKSSSVRDLKIQVLNDHLGLYLLLNFFGRDLWLLVEGRVSIYESHLRFHPIGGQFGALPVPGVFASAVLHWVLPLQSTDHLLLPGITSVQLRNGELLVSSFR
jgi:hypothetical protein